MEIKYGCLLAWLSPTWCVSPFHIKRAFDLFVKYWAGELRCDVCAFVIMFFHSKGKHKGYVSGWQTTQHSFVVKIKTVEEHQTAKTQGMEIKASESQRVSIGVVHKEGCWCTQMSILRLISVVVCICTDGNRGSNAAKTEHSHETALSELVDVGEASAQQHCRVNCEGHGVRVRKVERR